MSETLTLIAHIFNEEYLLPFWLEHHRIIFDHGIIIDYKSTDRSVEIIRNLCPTWEIVTTKNLNPDGSPNFQAVLVDKEVNEIEEKITSYKIALNVTEFLFINKSKEDIMKNLSKEKCYYIEVHNVMSNKKDFYPKNNFEFIRGIELVGNASNIGRGHRILHCEPKLNYVAGRHYHIRSPDTLHNNILCRDLFFILWTKFYPHNDKMFERKLQIQNNIPESDKDKKLGIEHFTDKDKLIEIYNNEIATTVVRLCDTMTYIIYTIEYTCNLLKQK